MVLLLLVGVGQTTEGTSLLFPWLLFEADWTQEDNHLTDAGFASCGDGDDALGERARTKEGDICRISKSNTRQNRSEKAWIWQLFPSLNVYHVCVCVHRPRFTVYAISCRFPSFLPFASLRDARLLLKGPSAADAKRTLKRLTSWGPALRNTMQNLSLHSPQHMPKTQGRGGCFVCKSNY